MHLDSLHMPFYICPNSARFWDMGLKISYIKIVLSMSILIVHLGLPIYDLLLECIQFIYALSLICYEMLAFKTLVTLILTFQGYI